MISVECPTNVTINNGYVRFTSDGSMASFRCTNGFKLVGAFSITCNEDGTWNLPPPKCVGMINVLITGLHICISYLFSKFILLA